MNAAFRKLVPTAALAVALAACAGTDELSRLQPPGYIADAQQLVARADWSAPEVVTVAISDYAFTPNELTFHRDRPARLVLKNTSDTDHTFVSKGFFQAIAVERVAGPEGEKSGPYVEKIVIPAGQTKELWFIPGRYGAWTFECTRPGHALLGMTGVVNVVK
ncbi:MAG: cupredoxin domain-containing protein [Magnetospirillum sp.]|nr:cupredoxin domain-containing protein [Magnetospirillum sp.]